MIAILLLLQAQTPPAARSNEDWHVRVNSADSTAEAVKALMLEADITTLQLIWRERGSVFHSRNPFPVGGIVEDPATGAAAAALGGYLRATGSVTTPATLTIRQGEAMGRPSLLRVDIPPAGGIVVSGTAIHL